MNKVKITSKEQIQALAKNKNLAWQGPNLNDDILEQIESIIKSYKVDTSNIIYNIIPSKVMNEAFELNGGLEFGENVSIVVVTGIDYSGKMIKDELWSHGGRYFDDVVADY